METVDKLAPTEAIQPAQLPIIESLIQVVQLPIIENQLQTMKASIEKRTADALLLVCTEDTIQAVKSVRAELSKQFSELEDVRKAVKNAILKPYNEFEDVYKECVSEPFKAADAELKVKISDVEAGIKQRCEDGLREYFAELCAVHHLEWLAYEQAGIKIDMASAKAKTPRKLQDQLQAFVVSVRDSVERIVSLEDADEIMVEYRKSLDAARAICTVQERHRRIEEEKAVTVEWKEVISQESEAVRRVEASAQPVPAEPEPVLKCVFTVHATKTKLRKLKEFLITEGIQYE